jgi:hypothetical protein
MEAHSVLLSQVDKETEKGWPFFWEPMCFHCRRKTGNRWPFVGPQEMGSEKSALFLRAQAGEYNFRGKQLFVFGNKLFLSFMEWIRAIQLKTYIRIQKIY